MTSSSDQEPWTSTSGGRWDVYKWLWEAVRDVTVHLKTVATFTHVHRLLCRLSRTNCCVYFVVCFRQFWKFGMAQSTWFTSALIRNANFEWRHQSGKTTNKTYYILIFVIVTKEDCSKVISLTTWWHLDEKQIYHLSSANPAYFYEVLQKLRTEMKSKKAKKRKENHLQNKSMTLIPEVLWLWLVQLWLQVQGVRSWLFCPLPMLTVQAVTPCRSAASDWLRWAWHWWWKPWRRRRSGFSWHTSVDSSSSGGLGAQRRQDESD